MALGLLIWPLSLIIPAPTQAPQLRTDHQRIRVTRMALLDHSMFGVAPPRAPQLHTGHQRIRVTCMTLLDHSMFGDGVCAFAASGLSTCLLHPIDTIKTRLQSPAYATADKPRSESTSAAPSESLFEHLYAGLASSMMKEVRSVCPNSSCFLWLRVSL